MLFVCGIQLFMATMKAEHVRRNSPPRAHDGNNVPVHLNVKKKKKRERGVPTAIEVFFKPSCIL